MSANATTAMHGQSSQVGPLGAAALLTAVVAFGALGFVIGQGVGTTTAERPVAGPVIDSTPIGGPRTGVQKGLGTPTAIGGVDPQYEKWVAVEEAARHAQAAAAAYGGSEFAGQYEQWLAAKAAASSSDFPDYFQRLPAPVSAIDLSNIDLSKFKGINLTEATVTPTTAENGSEFAKYHAFLLARAAAASSDFPDYYERLTVNTGTSGLDGYGGSDFAGQYERWLAAQAAASDSDFSDYHQRHPVAPTSGNGEGGRDLRLIR